MNDLIFKNILEDSPLVYFSLKGVKNKNGEYIDAILLDGNKSFSLLYSRELGNFKNKLLSSIMLPNDFDRINFDLSFNLAKKNNKSSSITYSTLLDKHLNSEIYHTEDDVFIVRLIELNNDHIKFSKILQNSPFLAWIKDRDGKYIDVNDKFIKKCGRPSSEIIGATDNEFWIKENVATYKSQDEDIMKTKNVYHYQEHIISLHKSDENDSKIYDVTKWPYLDIDGNVLGVIGIAIEVIDKIELRENLKQNEKNFTEITKYSEEVFILCNINKVLYVSPAFNNVFGKSADMLFDDCSNWKNYFHPEDIKSDVFFANFETEVEFVKRVNPKYASDKWVWVKSLPIKDERGNIIKKIIIISDVTKKKNIDLELENLKMDFFANISHELRTPLNVIFSALQFLKLKSDILNYSELDYINRYLNIIEQNGFRLLKLVNNLIDSTKIDAGYLEYNPQNFDIINFVENISMSVSDFINQHNMNLVFDTDEEEKFISFDLDMMERIILNLLSNAIKFNCEEGEIEVFISCDEYINISVKDNGIGIEPDKLDSIFGRFEQISSKKTHKREGSGIGLALVKSLVDLHNGKLSATSEVNKGTTFTVSIPNTILENEPTISNTNFGDDDNKVNRLNVEFSDIYI